MRKYLILLAAILATAGAAQSAEPLAAYLSGGLWRIIDDRGKEIFKPLDVEIVGGYSDGYFRVRKAFGKDTLWGFVNLQRQMGAPPGAVMVYGFSDGMAAFSALNRKDSLYYYGFVNTSGEIAVEPHYLDISNFSEGLAFVMNKSERGYIDKKGKFVLPMPFGFGRKFSEGFASYADSAGRSGYIDKTGKSRIPFKFDEANEFSEGIARVNYEGYYGYIDTTGKFVVEPHIYYADDYREGFAWAGMPDSAFKPLWGVINQKGQVACMTKFHDHGQFSGGIAPALTDSGWIFIDYYGEPVINGLYATAGSFSGGLAWAEDAKTGKRGFLNPAGEFEITLPKNAIVVVDLRLNKIVWRAPAPAENTRKPKPRSNN
ncbi:MAG: WG repeat-containing protein [Chloroflexota bacterium]